MHIDIITEGRLTDIVEDGFDLGVRVAGLVPADMIAVAIGPPTAFAVVATPSYFEQHDKPRSPADLVAHRCIRARLPKRAIFAWQFEKYGQQLEVDFDGPLTLDGPGLVQTAFLGGVGLGFLIEADVLDDLATRRLVRVLEDWGPLRLSMCNQSAALKAFIAAARKLSPWNAERLPF